MAKKQTTAKAAKTTKKKASTTVNKKVNIEPIKEELAAKEEAKEESKPKTKSGRKPLKKLEVVPNETKGDVTEEKNESQIEVTEEVKNDFEPEPIDDHATEETEADVVVNDKETDAEECTDEPIEAIVPPKDSTMVDGYEEAEEPENPKENDQNDGAVDEKESVEALHDESVKPVEDTKKGGFIRKKLGNIRRLMNYYWNGTEID